MLEFWSCFSTSPCFRFRVRRRTRRTLPRLRLAERKSICMGRDIMGFPSRHLLGKEMSKYRPPYNERLVIRAVTMGIDSGGNRLNAAMPKYQLTREQADDLVAYLKRL